MIYDFFRQAVELVYFWKGSFFESFGCGDSNGVISIFYVTFVLPCVIGILGSFIALSNMKEHIDAVTLEHAYKQNKYLTIIFVPLCIIATTVTYFITYLALVNTSICGLVLIGIIVVCFHGASTSEIDGLASHQDVYTVTWFIPYILKIESAKYKATLMLEQRNNYLTNEKNILNELSKRNSGKSAQSIPPGLN